jgi:hypothetical protein
MKYNFSLNQYAVITHGLKLDVIDLCVFDAFKDLANSAGCIKRIDDGRVYFWIDYKIVIENAPMLGLNSKDSVYRRMKKLEAAGVIMFHNENQITGKTFFAWGRTYDLLVFSKDGQAGNSTGAYPYTYGRSSVPPTDNHPYTYGRSSVPPTDNHPYNNNTNDNSTNNSTNDNSTPKTKVFASFENENDVFENELLPKKKRTQKKDTPGARRELLSKNGKVILPDNYTGAAMDSFNEVLESKSKEKKLETNAYNWEQSRQRDFASIKKIVEMVSFAVVEKEFAKTKEFVTIQPEKITQAIKIFFGGAFDYFYAIHENKGGGVMFAPSSCQRNFNYIIQNILNSNKPGSNTNHKSNTTKKHEALANTVIGLRERAFRSLYGDDSTDQNAATVGANRTIEI